MHSFHLFIHSFNWVSTLASAWLMAKEESAKGMIYWISSLGRSWAGGTALRGQDGVAVLWAGLGARRGTLAEDQSSKMASQYEPSLPNYIATDCCPLTIFWCSIIKTDDFCKAYPYSIFKMRSPHLNSEAWHHAAPSAIFFNHLSSQAFGQIHRWDPGHRQHTHRPWLYGLLAHEHRGSPPIPSPPLTSKGLSCTYILLFW